MAQLVQQEHRAFKGLRAQKEIQGQLVQQEHRAFRGLLEQMAQLDLQEHRAFRVLQEQRVQLVQHLTHLFLLLLLALHLPEMLVWVVI